MFGINQTEQNLTKKKTIKTSMLMRQWQTLTIHLLQFYSSYNEGLNQ